MEMYDSKKTITKACTDREISQVFAEIIWNNEVRKQDIRRLSELGVPVIEIALSLLNSDEFIEAVNNWCNENSRKEFADVD